MPHILLAGDRSCALCDLAAFAGSSNESPAGGVFGRCND